jgi:hypothetical protein
MDLQAGSVWSLLIDQGRMIEECRLQAVFIEKPR